MTEQATKAVIDAAQRGDDHMAVLLVAVFLLAAAVGALIWLVHRTWGVSMPLQAERNEKAQKVLTDAFTSSLKEMGDRFERQADKQSQVAEARLDKLAAVFQAEVHKTREDFAQRERERLFNERRNGPGG